MKTAAALLLATAAVANVNAQVDINPLILGGTVVPAGTKTFVTGSRQTDTTRTQCGGALISPTHVLTAAHCQSIAKYVAVGTHFASGSSDGELIQVKRQIVHPNYNSVTFNYDYSILELAKPATKGTPIKLLSADSETFASQTATVLGWGNTIEVPAGQNGYPSNELLRVNVPVLSRATCQTKNLSGALSATMFCAGGATNRDSCQGDSGGPLILERTTGDVLIGVVSWGDGCGRTNKPGVYSKVSYVKSWIQANAPNATWV